MSSSPFDLATFPLGRAGPPPLALAFYVVSIALVQVWLGMLLRDRLWATLGTLAWALSPFHAAALGLGDPAPWLPVALLLPALVIAGLGGISTARLLAILALQAVAVFTVPLPLAAGLLLPLMLALQWRLASDKDSAPGGDGQPVLLWLSSIVSLTGLAYHIVRPLEPSPLVLPAPEWARAAASAFVAQEHLLRVLLPFGRQAVLRPLDPLALLMLDVLFWMVMVVLARQVLRMRRRFPPLFFGACFFILAFLPASGLLPRPFPPFSDAYLPLPALGVVLVLAAAGHLAVKVLKKSGNILLRYAAAMFLAAAAAWAVLLPWESWQRVQRWNAPSALVIEEITNRPTNPFARVQQVCLLAETGDTVAADALFIELQPSLADLHYYPILHAELAWRKGDLRSATYLLETIQDENPYAARAQRLRDFIAKGGEAPSTTSAPE